jgi:glyoxylase-like metal-dependent hydrolase (beta-lactamase superfamily II)
MRRSGLLPILLAVIVSLSAAGAGAEDTMMLTGRYAVKGDGAVNTYILDSGSTIVIVDAQRQNSLAGDVVDVVGDRADRVEAILITSPRPDFATGIDVLREAFAVPVYASQATADELASDSRGLWAGNRELFPGDTPSAAPAIDRIVANGEMIDLGDFSFEVVELDSGEATATTLYFEPSRRMLIAGDLFAVGRTPMLADGHALDRIRQLDAVAGRFDSDVMIYPGYGTPAPLGELVPAQKDYLETFVTLVREARQDGLVDDREKDAIVEEMEVRYSGYTSATPQPVPDLLRLNVEGVARELARAN